jgi:hypothetical protein
MQKWEYLYFRRAKVSTILDALGKTLPEDDTEFLKGLDSNEVVWLEDVRDQSSVEDKLNTLGEEGWELVSMDAGYGATTFVFKRPKK